MPENCRWATRKQQHRNQRSNVWLTHNGRTLCVADWADKLGMSRSTLTMRLRRGWSVERALSTPV
jgi:AraC-like DNA-binding protein